MKWWLIFVGAILILADRWTKWLALNGVVKNFGVGEFILFKNNALVFSWPAPNWVAMVLMVVAISIVFYIGRRMFMKGNIYGSLCAVLVLIGATSNLFDRVSYGFVIDWAYLGRWWPVFNVADVMIGVGIVLIISSARASINSHGLVE